MAEGYFRVMTVVFLREMKGRFEVEMHDVVAQHEGSDVVRGLIWIPAKLTSVRATPDL